ncbi:MAG: HypC/HybG/HupF family hydrogenase formation chaperone [Bilophila wadsworthia]
MCLAIPAKVIEKSDDGMLKATVGNGPTCLTVSGILLPEEVEIGDYIIIRIRHARWKTEAEEACTFSEAAQATGRKTFM